MKGWYAVTNGEGRDPAGEVPWESEAMAALREKVALACRILYMEGHGDMYLGHVSARVGDDGTCLMKPTGMGIEEVTADDIIAIDPAGNRLWGKHRPHNEFPIHTEVYRARPDVGAVVHTHPPFATALAATRRPLLMVNHDAVTFAGEKLRVWDFPELIVTREQGEAMARALGSGWALLLRNHGIVAVGRTVEEAVFHALSLEKAAKIQLIATGFGELGPLAELVAGRMHDAFNAMADTRVKSIWEYYCRKLARYEHGNVKR